MFRRHRCSPCFHSPSFALSPHTELSFAVTACLCSCTSLSFFAHPPYTMLIERCYPNPVPSLLQSDLPERRHQVESYNTELMTVGLVYPARQKSAPLILSFHYTPSNEGLSIPHVFERDEAHSQFRLTSVSLPPAPRRRVGLFGQMVKVHRQRVRPHRPQLYVCPHAHHVHKRQMTLRTSRGRKGSLS